jgi:hypothetical protein
MTTQTETTLLTDWSGYQYARAGELYEALKAEEYEHLDEEQKLRLALFAANQHATEDELHGLIEIEEESYRGEFHSGAEFAEEMATEADLPPQDFPDWLVIDWQASYERNLRHDFFEYDVRINGEYLRFFWYAY